MEGLLKERRTLTRLGERLLRLKLKLLELLLLGCSLGYWGRKVKLRVHGGHVHPLVLAVTQTLPDEVLGLRRHRGLVGELDICGLQDGVLLQDGCLGLIVPEWLLSVQALIKYHTNAPNIHFRGDFRRSLADNEALWWQVPVGPGTLTGQVHALVRFIVFFIHNFGQTKVGDLDVAGENVSTSEKNITSSRILSLYPRTGQDGFIVGDPRVGGLDVSEMTESIVVSVIITRPCVPTRCSSLNPGPIKVVLGGRIVSYCRDANTRQQIGRCQVYLLCLNTHN